MYSEGGLSFDCAGESLLGIVTVPEKPAGTGVLVAVGGPQYRVGSHRQFLLLARALASAGIPVMRFDYRGMGDSSGAIRDFETVTDDIAAAIEAFRSNCPPVERVVLWGLCDAASAGLLYWDATLDARVAGLVLLNPWVRSEATLARTHIKHYYGRRLFQAEFWRKLLLGKIGVWQALRVFLNNWMQARQPGGRRADEQDLPFQAKMMRALAGFPGRILLVLSGDDYTAKEFLEAVNADHIGSSAMARGDITRVDMAAADHTFSSLEDRLAVEAATLAWLERSGLKPG